MKILKKITLGLIATAALALPMGANNAQAAGAEQSTPLAGQLVDVSTGRPISQVTVTITSDLTRYFLGHDVTVVTDANGRFSVDAPHLTADFRSQSPKAHGAQARFSWDSQISMDSLPDL